MPKITFYQVMNEELIKSACIILEKCFKNNFKTFVQFESDELKELLNKTLWTFSQKSFVPHGSDQDPLKEEQPIYLSTSNECPIKASVLMLIGKYKLDVEGYERVLIMVDGTSSYDVKEAKAAYESFTNFGYQLEYYRQNNAGGWDDIRASFN